MTLTLTKHHGLGNDFLVLLDPDDRYADAHASMAVALCHRTTGIGADGLLRLGPDLRMHLHNADGSRAEMIHAARRAAATRRRTAALRPR